MMLLWTGGRWSPSALFGSGEQGVWYDSSDLSTMYQDVSGTTPVTATGQPVGLWLDKRLGLVRGPELVTNGTFNTDITGWTLGTGTGTLSWNPIGALDIAATSSPAAIQTITTVAGKAYALTVSILAATANAGVQVNNGGTWGFGIYGSANAPGARTISTIFVATGTSTTIGLFAGGTTGSATFDNVSCKLLDGNHAVQSTAANRPTLQQDAGGNYYLQFNGTNSYMASISACDLSASDKVLVLSGVLKTSSLSGSFLCELGPTGTSTSNPGTFVVDLNGIWANGDWVGVGVSDGGIVDGADSSAATFTSGTGRVVSVALDMAQVTLATEIGIRINKVAQTFGATSGSGAASGNFASTQTLNIGARAGGPTLFLNGQLYGLVIRGTLSSAAQISQAETWMGRKLGVSL